MRSSSSQNSLAFFVAAVLIVHCFQGTCFVRAVPKSTPQGESSSSQTLSSRIRSNLFDRKRKKEGNIMGQAVRIMKYDRAENERTAIGALNFVDQALEWYRLDDGVMGGQSETIHSCLQDGSLNFEGNINTNGGGFCSIRAPIPNGLPPNTEVIRIRFIGDGKTYKLTLSDGKKSTFGPSLRSPSWQADIPSKKDGKEESVTIPFADLLPTWGGGPRSQPSAEDRAQVKFNAGDIKEIGVMLSLKLSDGSPNPTETFGEGVFPFSLRVSYIEPIVFADDEGEKK
jgi:hypothetical protein